MQTRGTEDEGEVLERPLPKSSARPKDRPSLVEMTREQYETLLARALGRPPRVGR